MKKSNVKKLKQCEFPALFRNIFLVPTQLKHDSGYGLIALVGETRRGKLLLVGYCDDVNWELGENITLTDFKYKRFPIVRTDMEYRSGIFRYWSNDCDFFVKDVASSTSIYLVPKNEQFGNTE